MYKPPTIAETTGEGGAEELARLQAPLLVGQGADGVGREVTLGVTPQFERRVVWTARS